VCAILAAAVIIWLSQQATVIMFDVYNSIVPSTAVHTYCRQSKITTTISKPPLCDAFKGLWLDLA
jgi:hypothetical protein